MLNGLKALFTSGIIFRPMVLSGVIIGFLLSSFLDWEEAFPLFGDLSFYLMAIAVSGLYTLFLIKYIKEEAGNLIMAPWAALWSATCSNSDSREF